MRRVPRLLLAFVLANGVATIEPAARLMASPSEASEGPAQAGQRATLKPAAAASADIPFGDSDFQSEQQLLEFANQARRKAGVMPLQIDAGLSQAARTHAQAMMDARQLSHRFSGELSLPQRLAATTLLQLDQEGENVAFDYDAAQGHQHLMLSPPHRANLLNPAYNVVGLGVARDGDRLYIVQDFAHALPVYSPDEVKDRIAVIVNQTRHQARQSDLPRHDLLTADAAACSMAHADKLATDPVRKLSERFTVLTYTSLHPETLPAGAARAIASRSLRSFSVGTCYSRTDTYPTGVYWVVLSLD